MSLPRLVQSHSVTGFNHRVRDQILGSGITKPVTSIVQTKSLMLRSSSQVERIETPNSRSSYAERMDASKSGVYGSDSIICPSHPSYTITNICLAQECIEPLCPECIHDHLQFHIQSQSDPQVENIQNVREGFRMKTQEYMKRLIEDLNDVDNHELGNSGPSRDKFLQSQLQQLEDARRQAVIILDDMFDECEQQMRQKSSRSYNLQHEFNQVRQHIQKELEKVRMLLDDFESPTEYVKASIYAIDKQIGYPTNGILAELESEINHYEQQLPQVVINIKALDDLSDALKSYVSIQSHHEPPNRSLKSSFKPNQQSSPMIIQKPPIIMNKSDYETQLSIARLQSIRPLFVSNSEELTHSPMKSAYPQIRIDNPSKNSSFICTFLDDQKQGLIYTFGQNKQVDYVEIEIENRLPHNHGSIIVDGQAYLLGGIVKDFDRQNAISSVYKVILRQQKALLLGNMFIRRQGFGIASVGNHIYVVGGSFNDNESQGTNHFERMDISSSKWSPLTPAIYKSTGCTLVSFNENFLMKFGGLDKDYNLINEIEIYNIYHNRWQQVKAQDHNGNRWSDIPMKAGAIQINNNEIFIFGGTVKDGQTDDCWLAQMHLADEISEIRVKRTHSLPFSSEVKSPIVFHNRKIYTFINRIQMGQSSRQQRALVECNADGWSQIG